MDSTEGTVKFTAEWPEWIEELYQRLKREYAAPSICIWGLLDKEDLDDNFWIGYGKWL